MAWSNGKRHVLQELGGWDLLNRRRDLGSQVESNEVPTLNLPFINNLQSMFSKKKKQENKLMMAKVQMALIMASQDTEYKVQICWTRNSP